MKSKLPPEVLLSCKNILYFKYLSGGMLNQNYIKINILDST